MGSSTREGHWRIASKTLDHEAGAKPRRPRRVKITPADDDEVPWSQIRELDERIEALVRQQLHVQAALRRRSSNRSYRGILHRLRFLFGCGTNHDHNQLEDTLGWLRKKEAELHDVKLSLLREAAYRQQQSHPTPDPIGGRARKSSAPAACAATPAKFPRVRSKASVVHRTGLVKAAGTYCDPKGSKTATVRRSPTAASVGSTNEKAAKCKFHTAGSAPDSSPTRKKPSVRRRVSFADDWQAEGKRMSTTTASVSNGSPDVSAGTVARVNTQVASPRSSIFPVFSPSPPPGPGCFAEGEGARVIGDSVGEESPRGSKGIMRGSSQRSGCVVRTNSMAAGEAFGATIPDPPISAPPPPPPIHAPQPSQQSPTSMKKDVTLRKMHDLLTNSLWVMDVEGQSAQYGASRVEGAMIPTENAEVVGKETPPSLWVSGYVDKLNNFGLGFLLSDGSVGVAFNSGITMVLQPAGVAFDYIKRARSSSKKVTGTESQEREEMGLVRTRHTVEDSPLKLRKHVILLKDLRRYIHTVGGELGEPTTTVAETEKGQALGEDEDRNGVVILAQEQRAEPMPFVQQFYRTQWMVLFGLSNGTVQVLFSDRSEVLLSDKARLITYVSKHGRRETFTLHRALREKRRAVIKRVRCCNRLIARALRGSN